MNKMILVIDESGAKGYSDNMESVPGEFGVMAGYLLSHENLGRVKDDLDGIRATYLGRGKLHITDLDPKQQQTLRNEIFHYFMREEVRWIYEATYVQGFHEHTQHIQRVRTSLRESSQSKIKRPLNKKYELMHAELFQGAFGKALAYCTDYGLGDFEIATITDRTDKKIIQKFKEYADELLHFGQEKQHKVSGYDPDSNLVIKKTFTIQIVDVENALDDFSGITHSITCEDSSLTLAADVLANSVHYHLKEFQKGNIGSPLNKREAISLHPLQHLVYGTHNHQESNYIFDALYLHPEGKKKIL